MIAPARTEPIAVVVKVWPKLSETFILEEILALERRGVPVRLYTLEPPSDELRHVDVDRVRAPISAVPALSSAWSGLLKATLVAALTHPWCWLRAMALAWRRGGEAWGDLLRAAHLAQQLRRDGAQRLHVHFIARTADIAELAARASGLPLSISAHAKDIYLSPPADLHRKLMAASFTVTCTEHNRRTLAEIAPQAVVRRMYHGIDHDRFHPRVRASQGAHVRRILAVGRLKAKKGLDTLVDACRLLRDQGRQVECVIVGYGDAQAALEQQIRAHDLGDVIRLAGKLPREGVIQCYATAEVFVQPSRVLADGDRDGIPNVMLEAMSMALPVVASRVSGIPEVIEHGANGLLVEPDAPAELAAAIDRLLDDRALAATLGAQARATVMRAFDNDTNLGLLLDLMDTRHACSHETCTA